MAASTISASVATRLARVIVVDIDAIRALGGKRDGDGNQLLVLYRNGSSGDSRLVEGKKGLHHFRREAVHFLQLGQVFFAIHIID